MGAKVVSLSAAREQAAKAARQAAQQRAKTALTPEQVFSEVLEDTLMAWQAAATKNRLSEHIAAKLPKYARSSDPDADYVNDLNVLSGVERRLSIKVAVFYPGCTLQNPYGWLAAFYLDRDIFSTPPDMASEANARALNVLLYLALEDKLRRLGRR
jgi:hypothetical protein